VTFVERASALPCCLEAFDERLSRAIRDSLAMRETQFTCQVLRKTRTNHKMAP